MTYFRLVSAFLCISSSLHLLATLEANVECSEGLHADHVVHHSRSVGVVGAVVELLYHTGWVLKMVKPGNEIIQCT